MRVLFFCKHFYESTNARGDLLEKKKTTGPRRRRGRPKHHRHHRLSFFSRIFVTGDKNANKRKREKEKRNKANWIFFSRVSSHIYIEEDESL